MTLNRERMRLVPLIAVSVASPGSNESILVVVVVPELLLVAVAGDEPAPVVGDAGAVVENEIMHPSSFPTTETTPGYSGGAVVAAIVFVSPAPLLPRWPTRPVMVSVVAVPTAMVTPGDFC